MSESIVRARPVRRAGRRVRRAVPPGRAAAAERVHRQVPRAGRPDPRAVPGPGGDGAVRHRTADQATGPFAAQPRRGAGPRAAGRLPHPPRDRPRRHGRRLRGRPGEPGPARRPEGAAAPPPGRPDPARAVPAARREPRPGCTTPTSCRSSASASTTASTTTPCNTSRARPGRGAPRGQAAARRGRRRPPALRRRARPRAGGQRGAPSWSPDGSRGRARLPPETESVSDFAARGSGREVSDHRPRDEPGLVAVRLVDPGPVRVASYYRSVARIGVQAAEALAYAHHQKRAAPRHQAVQPPAGPPGDGLGDRLRPGQGRGDRRADPHRRHRRHAAVHGPRAVPGPGRRAVATSTRWG